MDHLTLWPGATWQEGDYVPYVAREDYIGVPFLEYLKPYLHLEDLEIAARLPDRERDCILQTCFFFSLLQEILGPLFSHSDYVKPANNSAHCNLVITTHLLEQKLRCWVHAVSAEDHEFRSSRQEHLRQCCRRISPIVGRRPFSTSRMVGIGIAATFDAIFHACLEAFRPASWPSPEFYDSWPDPHDLRIMVAQGGWCPFEAYRAWRSFKFVSTRMLLRSMKRPRFDARHQGCTIHKCDIASIKKEDFKCVHATELCSCEEMFVVDRVKLLELLQDGKTPVLRFTQQRAKAGIKAELVAADASLGYVAISHVWSDGLGNPNLNAVRICQVENLGEVVFRLLWGLGKVSVDDESIEAHVWLDTLCVPLEPLTDRLLALRQMVHYYRQASSVLVLDSDIQAYEHDFDDKNRFLLAGMIVSSARWRWRLWTFQEAVMAPKCYFAFSNGFAALQVFKRNFRDDQQRQEFSYGMRNVVRDIHESADVLSVGPDLYTSSRGSMLRHIHFCVRDRLLTFPSDEALCLANIMGFDVAIPETRDGDRMSVYWKILSQLGYFDATIIFNGSPRLSRTGLGWAPRSLLSQNGLYKPDEGHFDKHIQNWLRFPVYTIPAAVVVRDEGISAAFPSMRCRVNSASADIKHLFEVFDADQYILLRGSKSSQWYRFAWYYYISEELPDFKEETTCTLLLRTTVYPGSQHTDAVLAKDCERPVDQSKERFVETRKVGWLHAFAPAQAILLQKLTASPVSPHEHCMAEEHSTVMDLLTNLPFSRAESDVSEWLEKLHMQLRDGMFFDVVESHSESRNFVVG